MKKHVTLTETKKKEIMKRITISVILIVSAFIMTAFALMINSSKANVFTNYVTTVAALGISVALIFLGVLAYLDWVFLKREVAMSLGSLCGVVFTTLILTVLTSCATSKFISPYALTFIFSILLASPIANKRVGFLTSIAAIFVFMLTKIAIYRIDSIEFFDTDTVAAVIIQFVTMLIMLVCLKKNYTRFQLTGVAFLVAVASFALTAVTVTVTRRDPREIFSIAGFQLAGNVISIAFYSALLPLLEVLFQSWTDFRLAEICSFNNPLIKKLSEEAPGTYVHSIAVANLMENCAVALGLNPFMARACGYYHDIGKLQRPQMFVENQRDGYNPHDELIPEVSAGMIISHTSIGVETLKKAKMPLTVIKSAAEHHGDTEVQYFYLKAQVITEGKLDDEKYCYDGPRPTTKYSAMLMICDSIEAISRAKTFTDVEDLENTVANVIKSRLLDGQFDDCEITMLDLRLIKETICQVIPANLHERIDYNKAKENR